MSENGIVMRDAGVIAREINFIKEQTKRQMLAASMEIGARLCEAKELVGHGEWEKWLCENVDYSQSTANNLMRIYREYSSQQINLLTAIEKKFNIKFKLADVRGLKDVGDLLDLVARMV